MKITKCNKQKQRADAMRRYFLINYRMYKRRFLVFTKKYEGQLSCNFEDGKYVNKATKEVVKIVY